VAIATLGASSISLGSAWAAEPDNDGITPTANYQEHCAAGLASDTVCQTDNRNVSYYMDANGEFELEHEDRVVVHNVMDRYRDNTVLSISYDISPDFGPGPAETDVIYQEGDFGFPDAVIGVTWCNDPEDGTNWKCDQSYIRIRGNGRIGPQSAGHETGHSFGLLHGNRWAPSRDECADILGIMRRSLDCIDGAALGEAVVNNINWVY
jgi:hypothetical protein